MQTASHMEWKKAYSPKLEKRTGPQSSSNKCRLLPTCKAKFAYGSNLVGKVVGVGDRKRRGCQDSQNGGYRFGDNIRAACLKWAVMLFSFSKKRKIIPPLQNEAKIT